MHDYSSYLKIFAADEECNRFVLECTDHEILELILAFCDRSVVPSDLARSLLSEFQNLGAVVAAEPLALGRIDGMTPRLVASLRFINVLRIRGSRSRLPSRVVVATSSELRQYLAVRLKFCREERVYILYLDNNYGICHEEEHARGASDKVAVYPREIVKRALQVGAHHIIIAHNHPSHRPQPSRQDISITRQLAAACDALEINLIDHVIVAGESYVSMRDLGMMGDARACAA